MRAAWRIGALPLLLAAVLFMGTGYEWQTIDQPDDRERTSSPSEAPQLRQLQAALRRLAPAGYHIVIDQTHNRLEVRRGSETVLQAVCSAGSGYVLRERGDRGRTWVFDTPRGVFAVRHKSTNPVWRKPDWAFVEAGQPIPSDPGERFEYGVLGAYALYLGDGYMIHGTLYERLLGRSVTHGCIRLGREDLRRVYELVPVGAPVFIY